MLSIGAYAQEVRLPVKDNHWSAPQVKTPTSYRDEPWVICLLTEGPHLIYTAHLYTVQPRYGTWTVDWRRYRPRGYVYDEEVGLVTTVNLQRSLDRLLKIVRDNQLKPELIESSPPCSPEEVEARPLSSLVLDSPSITTWLWVLSPESTSAISKLGVQYRWYQWRFNDPHLAIHPAPRTLIRTVKDLVHTSAPPQEDVDRLLKFAERGSLILKISKPARVWIDGVYQGEWPSLRLIYLPDGHYSIHVVPLDPRYEVISYEDVEVLAGRQTTFKVQVE
jgi:hypothetical protein